MNRLLIFYKSCIFTLCFISCKKFVSIDPPDTSLIKATVFQDKATATAAIIDIYTRMINVGGYSNSGISSISYLSGLAADELDVYSTSNEEIEFATNNLTSLNGILNGTFWSAAYEQIYRCNAVLEGLASSVAVSSEVKSRLQGEAKFIRAFAYFYLINLFGDVPLAVTTDYRVNAVMPRTPMDDVYKQIVLDLKEAQNLLSENYLNSTGSSTIERKRVNKFAATAMLARVNLYLEKWQDAELEATKVIENTNLYGETTIQDMFLKNSREAIWQLGRDEGNTEQAVVFSSIPPNNGALRPTFYNAFDNNDLRKLNWILVDSSQGTIYYLPNKYKASPSSTPITEYYTVLRLAEQYLIRAEARTHLGKLIGEGSAQEDINYIRTRSGIENTNVADKQSLLAAIIEERHRELFVEWGHRWLDLKRTSQADEVIGLLKGSNWQTTDQLWPIPQKQLQNNPGMFDQQNPGYN